MERARQKRQKITNDGMSRDLMNAGRFCFSCEQIFANRKCLEEHVCSATSYICSCGTEFAEYTNMLEHSTTHEPGHQVLNHDTIKRRRVEKRIEEEKQLKRLQTGEVVWQAPELNKVPSFSLPVLVPLSQVPITSPYMAQVHMQPGQIPQVPALYPSVSQSALLPNPIPSSTDMKNIFAGVGAPTVDLWTLYQPVVLLRTVHNFNKKKPYACNKCGQRFETKTSLVFHHSSHVTDKVSGCIGCGLLLSSKKFVPRFHVCNSTNNATKFRLITASPNLSATSSPQLKTQNPTKGSRIPHGTSTKQLEKLQIITCSPNNQRLPPVTPSLLFKRPSPSTSKPYVTFSPPLKSQSPNPYASKNSSHGLPVIPSWQLKTPANSASSVSSKPMPTSSAANVFTCRVCRIPFETAQLLQRHKCIKAQEFMAQHVPSGKQHHKLKSVTPMASPNPAQMNGERMSGVPASGNVMKTQVMADCLNKGQGVVAVNGKTGVDTDDDCFIVESGPDKPAEMIYQVTSSVPITT